MQWQKGGEGRAQEDIPICRPPGLRTRLQQVISADEHREEGAVCSTRRRSFLESPKAAPGK